MTRISVKGQLLSAREAMGKRIKAQRRQAGLTQAELALELGVAQETVSRWEAGRVEIGTDDLRALGKALRAATGWLMEGAGPEPEPYTAPIRRRKAKPTVDAPVTRVHARMKAEGDLDGS